MTRITDILTELLLVTSIWQKQIWSTIITIADKLKSFDYFD